MEYRRFLPLLIPLLLCLAGHARAEETSDSLAYQAKRKQILEHAPDERATLTLGAAEELARDGYFAEALDLIYSMQDTASSADWDGGFPSDTMAILPQAPSRAIANTSGYIQSSMDFDSWEGIDTSVSAKIRAKMDWDPRGNWMDRVSTVFQGSDRNAYFEMSGKGSAWRRGLKFEADGQAEKRLWQAYGDSLDRLYLRTQLEGNTRSFGKPVSIVTPIFAEAQQYRYSNRFGSLSYRELGTAPGLEAISQDLRKSLFLSWEFSRKEFPSAPSAGSYRNGPVASGEWYGNRLTVDAETRFQVARYFRDTSVYRMHQLETRGGAFIRTWDWLRVGIRTLGTTQIEDYRDSVELADFNLIQAAYQLRGSSWVVQPQLIAEWASIYTASLSLSYSRARFPILYAIDGATLQSAKYLEESHDDWKPQAGITVLTKAIFFTLSADYEYNWVPASAEYSLGSSKGLGLNCNLFWKLRPWMELDFTGIASRRTMGSRTDRIQNFLTVSLGLTSRFP